MPSYTTRVELHYATKDDYDTLHAAMDAEGFSRYIASSAGEIYHLPTAEYDRTCQLDGEQIRASAAYAADKTGKTYSIIVTEAGRRYWQGLVKAGVFNGPAYPLR